MKIQKFFMLSLTALAVACFTSCKDDEPSQIPTIPTTFSLEDGALIESTEVQLSASGSTVEDETLAISYDYYIGTSADNMQKTDAEVKLEPYTQYFWYAQARTKVSESEMMDVRTFYCVPPFDIKADNGDGEWAAIMRFKNAKNILGGKVVVTPDHSGYEIDPIEIPVGQDSCYLKMTRYSATENNACVQDFDDEHGKYYIPVIYNFDVSLDIQVGDKKFTVNNSAKNIILNKQAYVRDHEFNVYRTVEINGATWMIDDYRAKSYIDKDGNVIQMKEGEDYVTNTLPSGAVGYYYNAETASKFDVNKSIKGYKVPLDEDYDPMLKSFASTYNEAFNYIASQYDWEERPIPGNMTIFNARPLGYYTKKDGFLFVGSYAMYFNKRYFDQSNRKYRTWFWEIPTIIENLATHIEVPDSYFYFEIDISGAFIEDNDEKTPYLIIRLNKI